MARSALFTVSRGGGCGNLGPQGPGHCRQVKGEQDDGGRALGSGKSEGGQGGGRVKQGDQRGQGCSQGPWVWASI